MFRKASKNFDMSLRRSGGSIVAARVDVWKPEQDQWKQVSQLNFDNPLKPFEKVSEKLPAGQYVCVFQCFVEESLNGRYDFDFAVAGKSTFVDSGDVNTTSAPNDAKVFKDQFVLKIS